jgi:LuxR family maltose regulon positive regulatory protein
MPRTAHGSAKTAPAEDESPKSRARARSIARPGRQGRARGNASDGGKGSALAALDLATATAGALETAGVAAPAARPPSFPRDFVRRSRLVRRLVEQQASLVLVTAPAGYGKTSLLSEWAEHDERPFAWVTLDEGHNDPARLLRTIAKALEEIHAIDPATAPQLAAPARRAAPRALPALLKRAGTLLRAIRADRRAPVLVLDDVHAVHAEESSSVLQAFAVGMPPGATLALASRTVPALPLGRLRAGRALLALDAGDLAMTTDQARRLLGRAGVKVGTAAAKRLRARTAGWPAGLYLASLALRGECRAVGVEAFAGDDHAVSEYIREEVLATCAPDARAFLAATSVLDELTPGVCDALLERSDSATVLSRIAASNLMVIPQDRRHSRYRCHPLLRVVLEAQLARAEPARAADLHRRASAWFRAQGDIERAIGQAAAATDASLTGELIWAYGLGDLLLRTPATAQGWLGRFSDEQLASSARLAICAAHMHLAMGDLVTAEQWARRAADARRGGERGGARASLEAGIAIIEAVACSHGLERMHDDARRAYELEDEASPRRAICCLLAGVAEHLAGERLVAREALEEGARRSMRIAPGVESLCLAQLAVIAGEDQEWERARELATSASGRLEACGLGDHPASALVFAAAAWVAANNGVAADAKRELRRAAHLLTRLSDFAPWYEVEVRVVLARACIRLADVELARSLLSQASRLARRMPDAEIFRRWLDGAWSDIDGLGASSLSGPSSLTMAELRILRFLPTHLSFREIGVRLHVSTNTVKSQAHAVYAKLGVASRSEAVARASALGLIEVRVI